MHIIFYCCNCYNFAAMNTDIAAIRKDYKLRSLNEQEVQADAMDQFGKWWNEAIASNIDEVNAMTLATAGSNGLPHARIVLLKGFDRDGFQFFTNYNSHKGTEIAENPHAALLFFWKELERQVRIEGTIEKLPEQLSNAYFSSRPEGSRIGAWASPQSTLIASRDLLEQNVAHYQETFAGNDIPRPPHWGGYLVRPLSVEFWQGRSSRLHDRILYTQEGGEWKTGRLAP
jgi:pyridoxamine 5'-phosphate oxidase